MYFITFQTTFHVKGYGHTHTGEEFRFYINPNRLIKNTSDVYKFSPFKTMQTSIQQLTLSSATVIYYLMFFFGSITRYHPYLFEKVLSEKEIWLVSEFLKTQPLQFLLLLTSKVLGKPLFLSRMPFFAK